MYTAKTVNERSQSHHRCHLKLRQLFWEQHLRILYMFQTVSKFIHILHAEAIVAAVFPKML